MSHSPRYAPHRPRFRRAALIGALLLAVLALTGCVTVQLKATVHSDGTVSGTARIGVAKSLASLGGGSALADLKSQDTCDFGGKKGTTKDFDDGTYVGIDCSFSNVTLAEFNAGEDGPKLTREGDKFHLTGSLNVLQSIADGSGPSASGSASGPATATAIPSGLPTDLSSLLPSGFPTDLSSLLPSGFPTDLSSLLPSGFPTDLSSLLPSGFPTDLSGQLPSGSGGLPSGLDPSTLLKTAKISFAFTFPGKVDSSKGKVTGKTVTFSPDSSGNVNFETTAAAKDSGSLGGLGSTAWIGLVVLVLVVLALVALLLRRRNRPPAQPAFAGGYPGPDPQYPPTGYPAQQTQPGVSAQPF
nr:hypothetical protein [Actinomycetota bacterium]